MSRGNAPRGTRNLCVWPKGILTSSKEEEMSGSTNPRGGITRRNFLKTTAAVTGAAAVAGGTSLTALAEEKPSEGNEQVKYVACRGNCMNGCQFKCTVRDGKIVKNEMAPMPQEKYNRICAKGLSVPQMTYSPDRIQYPMRRVGERGSGQWERISWDEAISEITGKWKGYIEEHSGLSIAQSGSGAGTLCGSYLSLVQSLFGFSSAVHQADMASIKTSMDYVGVSAPLFGG